MVSEPWLRNTMFVGNDECQIKVENFDVIVRMVCGWALPDMWGDPKRIRVTLDKSMKKSREVNKWVTILGEITWSFTWGEIIQFFVWGENCWECDQSSTLSR